MKILAIESSCDETAASVVRIEAGCFEILSNVVSSQVKVHAKYGGIVPEVAARLHIENILPVINLALIESTNKPAFAEASVGRPINQSTKINLFSDIDYIAVCSGPGLMSSLLVGVETAKTLAWVYKKPLIKINHLEGHLLSAESAKCPAAAGSLGDKTQNAKQIKNAKCKIQNNCDSLTSRNLPPTTYKLLFPAIGLIVSGGHTQIVLMKDYLKYKIIGQTRDDAAGEAFDKAAKILGLGYPGGPAIAAEAEKVQSSKLKAQNKLKTKNLKFKINLPRPMINTNDFDFSFSGLKTAILYKWQALQKELSPKELAQARPEMAHEIQNAIVDILVSKTIAAAKQFNAKTVILGGGVSANDSLREYLNISISKYLPEVKFLFPDKEFSGDNAAMIGIAAYYHAKNKDFVDPFDVKADANWQLV